MMNMQWFFIALAAPFLWAFVNIADKYLVDNFSSGKEKSSGALVLFSSLIGIFAAAIIGLFVPDIFAMPFFDKVLLILIGALSIVWIILYLFALEIEDVSAVVPWMLTIPIFGYLLGYALLGELLTSRQFLGMLIVLFGAAILSLDFNKIKILFKRKIMAFMLIHSLIYALNGTIFKFVASDNGFWASSFWEYLGLGAAGIMIFCAVKSYRQNFTDMINTGGPLIMSVNVMSEITTIAGNLLTNYALLIAPVALVFMVATFQPVAVLLLTFLLTKFMPKIIDEDFSRKVIIPKIIAIGVMLFGSAILFL